MRVMMKMWTGGLVVAFLVSVATPGRAQVTPTRLYNCFSPVEQFADIQITLVGTAEKMEITKAEILDFARKEFDERFGTLRLENLDVAALEGNKEEAKKTGLLQFTIWTINEKYPVVFLIEGRAGSAQCLFEGREFYKISHLGYIPEVEVRNTSKDAIRDVIDKVAKKFHDLRFAP